MPEACPGTNLDILYIVNKFLVGCRKLHRPVSESECPAAHVSFQPSKGSKLVGMCVCTNKFLEFCLRCGCPLQLFPTYQGGFELKSLLRPGWQEEQGQHLPIK